MQAFQGQAAFVRAANGGAQWASKGVGATRAETILHWDSEGVAQALGFSKMGRIAPEFAGDIALFDLSHPRNMGLHDLALAPMVIGAATVRHSFVNGTPLVVDGQIPWLNLADLKDDTLRHTSFLKERRQAALV